MEILTPAQVMVNRGIRMSAPVYSTDTATAARKSQARLRQQAEQIACTDDFCFICSRPTDHFGEHTVEQLLQFAATHPHFRRMMS